MKRRLRWFWNGLTVLSLLVGVALWWIARGTGGYTRAVESGRTDIEQVRQFDRLFPGATHFISYYTGTNGNPTWNSKAGLHGRYVLTMQIPISLSGLGRSQVRSNGTPTFILTEVQNITSLPGGQTSIVYSGNQITFGFLEWNKLVESNGDLSVLGITIKINQKIPGFVKYWQTG
jgi:hypothetical protein